MLKADDIVVEVYRLSGGSNSMKVIHKPTGIFRGKGPPLGNPGKAQREMISEIEAELVERGLRQYILPERKEQFD